MKRAPTRKEVDDIANRISSTIKKGNISKLEEMRKYLVESGIIESDASATVKLLSRYLLNNVSMPPVTKLELNVAENCNLRCDYCFVENKNPKGMPLSIAKKSVDFLMRESKHKKDISILFFGGEPLLEYEILRETVIYSKKEAKQYDKTLFFSMTTNGTLLNEERLSFFRDHKVKFLLSIDGNKECHDKHRKTIAGKGTFDSIKEKIPLIKSYQPWLGAKMTVLPDTIQYLYENIRFLHEEGINQFLFGPADGTEWSDKAKTEFGLQVKKVASFYRKEKAKGQPIRVNFFEEIESDNFFKKKPIWGCRAGRQSLSISPDGDIYPCSKMQGNKDLRKITKLGDLKEGITDSFLRMRLIGKLPIDRAKCLQCSYSSSCVGGCFAVNFIETGDIFKPSPKFECDFIALTADLAKNWSSRLHPKR